MKAGAAKLKAYVVRVAQASAGEALGDKLSTEAPGAVAPARIGGFSCRSFEAFLRLVGFLGLLHSSSRSGDTARVALLWIIVPRRSAGRARLWAMS